MGTEVMVTRLWQQIFHFFSVDMLSLPLIF